MTKLLLGDTFLSPWWDALKSRKSGLQNSTCSQTEHGVANTTKMLRLFFVPVRILEAS
jgi:hypothetical protein